MIDMISWILIEYRPVFWIGNGLYPAARGDLGVELELERVPFAQKLLIARAKKVRHRASGCHWMAGNGTIP